MRLSQKQNILLIPTMGPLCKPLSPFVVQWFMFYHKVLKGKHKVFKGLLKLPLCNFSLLPPRVLAEIWICNKVGLWNRVIVHFIFPFP